jgi:hypothetical protein
MGLITGLGIAFGGGSAFAAAVTGGKPVRASGAIQTLYLNLSDVRAGGIVFFQREVSRLTATIHESPLVIPVESTHHPA